MESHSLVMQEINGRTLESSLTSVLDYNICEEEKVPRLLCVDNLLTSHNKMLTPWTRQYPKGLQRHVVTCFPVDKKIWGCSQVSKALVELAS